jgi:broad specificity phosphatase PhoE
LCDPVDVRLASAFLAAIGLFLAAPPGARADESAAWSALAAGGHTLVLRHAATDPGIGDPPGFRLGDCSTQRNLSAGGRAQARAVGARLASRGIEIGAVLSSRWCRCLDTARLAFGRVESWTPLDSFFGDRTTEPERTREVLERAKRWQGPGTLVMVTHQVNISAATGESIAMGEGVVVDRAGRVVGRIATPP